MNFFYQEYENNTKKEIDLGEKRLDAGEYVEKDVCEDDDGHFIPRKLLLFKVEKFKVYTKTSRCTINGNRSLINKHRIPQF